MVMYKLVTAIGSYLVVSALLFLHPYPVTGSVEWLWMIAVLSGPAYKLFIFCQNPYTYAGEISIYPLAILIVWFVGLSWLSWLSWLSQITKWHIVVFGLFWFFVGLWNYLDFALTCTW